MGLIRDEHVLSERDITLFGHRKVYDSKLLKKDIAKAGLRTVSSGGVFLKPLPNSAMEKLDDKLIEGFYRIGKKLDPDLLAELYAFAGKK